MYYDVFVGNNVIAFGRYTIYHLMGIMQKLRRMEKKKNDHGGTRTHNLWIRSPTRYPLRHVTPEHTSFRFLFRVPYHLLMIIA